MARYREISKVFSYISLSKTCDPRGGAKFDPRAIHWTFLVEAHQLKLHAKFGKPRPCGKIQGDLAIFPSISQCKTCNPRGGAKFDPRAIPWTLLVEAH